MHPIMVGLMALDRALVANGWPALSPWWVQAFTAFVSAAVRQLVLRVGRRGGKSSSLCRFAVAFAIGYDVRAIPPGDVGIVGVVSVSRDEANQRLRTIKAILDVLGVRYRPIEGGIELADRPIVFKVFAASLGGVVGGTWILGICDELARWRDNDSGQNPASEVLASLRPTMATQPKARLFLSSSPLGELDAHFDAMALGDTSFQRVATAETWIANPTISEDETHALEPDEAIWSREYAAIPSAELETSLFTAFEIDRATRSDPLEIPRENGLTYEAAQDPATRGDRWTLAIGALRIVENRLVRSIVAVRSWQGTRSAPLDPRRVLLEIAAVLKSYGITSVWSDHGGGGDTMVSLGAACGVSVYLQPTTVVNKREMFESLKEQLRAGDVELPSDPQVRADLLAVRKRITRNGISIELPHVNGSHADHAPSIALCVSKLDVEPYIEEKRDLEALAKRERFEHFRRERDRPYWDRARGMSAYERERQQAAFGRRER